MELDPFLALEQTPSSPRSTQPTITAVNVDNADPVASLLGLGENHHETKAEASTIVIDRSSNELDKPAVTKKHSAAGDAGSSSSNVELVGQDLNEQLANLLINKQLPQAIVTSLQSILRENSTLKDKNGKLKSLLGRSAKAQRDAKHELEHMKKQYEELRCENERLERRVEQLANRPTHMDLLADFETNFDRALLSINNDEKGGQQSGGDTAEQSFVNEISDGQYDGSSLSSRMRSPQGNRSGDGADTLLLTELNESKSRVAQLESLQQSLQNRNGHLERTHKSLLSDLQTAKNSLTNLNLELRMSKMETEHALRTLREKEATMTEMQLEIDLVAKSAAEANRRAVEGMEAVKSVKFDKEYVEGLEAQVAALQEWALASTESKRLTTERCHGLEDRVKELQEMVTLLSDGGDGSGLLGGSGYNMDRKDSGSNITLTTPKRTSSSAIVTDDSDKAPVQERQLWTKSSSLVVGAGMVGHEFVELGTQEENNIQPYETVVLRWKFDLTPSDLDIYFSILKGVCEDKKSQRNADACLKNRHVQGGGGGEVSGAFAVKNSCTLLWSNEMSWVRPRTIKWTVNAVAVEWSD